jgi:GTP pyrophosphokinase
LNIAVTNSAKAKIRSWFKKEKREENIETGRSELEKELRRSGINLNDREFEEVTADLAKRMHYSETDEFFSAIGYGGILISKIIPRIREDYSKRQSVSVPEITDVAPKSSASPEGVIVDGIDNCLIRLSRCCSPLPGDEIIGFITRGHGVSIHKRDCNNVPADISASAEPERWIAAHWDTGKREHFISTVRIFSVDRDGLLADIMSVAYNMRLAVHAMNAHQTGGGNCVIAITINTESVEHLRSIISQIEKISGVYGVERVVK